MNLKRSVQFLTKTLYSGVLRTFATTKRKQSVEPQAVFYKPSSKVKDQKLSPEAKSAMKSDLLEDTLKPEESQTKLPAELKNLRPQEILKRMDTSIEGFFYKREYNLANFNFLLQALAEKKDKKGALSAFEKMKELGISPTRNTYIQLLTAFAKAQDVEKAESVFMEAKKLPGIGVDTGMYNSLMLLYTRRYEPEKALKIFYDMKSEGLQPDVVCYTTLINSYKNKREVAKAWELFDKMMVEDNVMPDEHLFGLMIEICAATRDAEKAKNLFLKMSMKGFSETCLPYNALIKALGSRPDYAQEALDYHETMLLKGIAPDSDTYIALFKATSSLGDVKTAFNGLINMKSQKIPLTLYHYKGLLRTYAGACKIPQLSQETKNIYLKDAWKLFEQMQTVEKLPVNVHILNSLLLVHASAIEPKQLEDFVLPLYEKYAIQLDENTYEFMMELYLKLQDLKKVVNLMDDLLQKGISPTYNTLNDYLETAIRLDNREKILHALQLFKKHDKQPRNRYLKILGEAEDIPDDIYLELHGFDRQYGFIQKKTRLLRKPDKYSAV